MDIQAYFQSGILEAYALGALTAPEAAEVEAQMAAHPEIHAELVSLQDALRRYAEASPLTPPHDLEERIWKAIDASRVAQTSPPSENRSNSGTPRVLVLPQGERRRASFSYARAAVWAGLVGSLILNGVLFSNHRSAQERISRLEARRDRESTFFASQLSDRDHRLQAYALMKDLMADPAVKTVRLENLRPDAQRASIVFQNTQSGAAYLAVQKLPPPPPGKQYQLWVLHGGTPKGLALLQKGADVQSLDEIQLVPVTVSNGEAFAISIEAIGGSLTPTMDQIVMLGKVQA